MGEVFNVAEVVRVAVEDERSGVAFYSALAEKARDPKLRETFADLSAQEKVHQKRFEEMLAALGDYKAPERYSDEYVSYLGVLTRDRAFPDEQAARDRAADCGDDAAALELASRFERDTLILMEEMQKLVRDKHREIIDEMADEERDHLVALDAARRRLAG